MTTSSQKYLTAQAALKIVERQSFPVEKILDTLIRKVEYKIRIVATLKGFHTFWYVPFVYAAVPAYNSPRMCTHIAQHLRDNGFYVKPVGPVSLWISWKYAGAAKELLTLF